MKTGLKKVGLGWTLGGGAMLLIGGVGVVAITGVLVALALIFGILRPFTFGSVLGVGAILLFKPLIVGALIVLAVIGATLFFLGSRPASPTSAHR